MNLVILGLSLSSSWGNGHATTYRALLRGLAALGHRARFLERDVPWYAGNRDLPDPDFCDLSLYSSVADLIRFRDMIADADAVIVGSYVPDGVAVIDMLLEWRKECVSFYDIDTPITLARLRLGEEEYVAGRQIPRFDTCFSFAGGPTLAALEDEFGAARPVALYCAVDEVRYRPTGEAPRWDLGYVGTYSDDRQAALERLLLEPARRLPDRRFVVAGPMYPDTIDWPDNVERLAHLPPDAHASFYSRQRFTLNVTRAEMAAIGWSPSVRLFEAAACGTPIISDRWRGLDEILPADSILVADTTDDVVRALVAPERQRLARASRARAGVLAGHTGKARAAELVTAIGSIRTVYQQAPEGIQA